MPVANDPVSAGVISRHRLSLSPQRRHALVGAGFVCPAVLFFAVFYFYPMADALSISFTQWDLLTPARPVGLANYTAVLSSHDVLSSLGTTLVYTAETVLPLVLLSLGLALLLNRRAPCRSLYRLIYVLPVVLPPVVSAIIWGLLYQPTGPVNSILGLVGVTPIRWITSGQYALPALAIVAIWSAFGYDTLILLAGLQSIPPEYQEAAAIDGASRRQILRRITLPLLAPRLLLVTVTSTAAALTEFTLPYVMTRGGPGTATRTLALLIYQNGFQFLNAGRASAMAVVLMGLTVVFTLVQFRLLGTEAL